MEWIDLMNGWMQNVYEPYWRGLAMIVIDESDVEESI